MRILTKILICGALVVSFAPESAFADGCLRARGFGTIDGYAEADEGTPRKANKAQAVRTSKLNEFLAEPFVPGAAATVDRAKQLSDCYEQGYLLGIARYQRGQETKLDLSRSVSGMVNDVRSAWDRYVATPFARWLIPTAKDIDFTGAGINVSRDADTRTVPAASPSNSSTGASAAGLKRD